MINSKNKIHQGGGGGGEKKKYLFCKRFLYYQFCIFTILQIFIKNWK